MKNILKASAIAIAFTTALICTTMWLLSSCTAPKFVVVAIEAPDNDTHNCLITAVPINRPAFKMSQMGEITLLGTEYVKVKDTVTITRKEWTNYPKRGIFKRLGKPSCD